MKMNKMFAGLIAFVAGVALSAGSAFATAGYVGGDPAMMKLVPYYETGDMKATIIGIQNMSPQETSTMIANNLVTSLKAYLAGTMNANAAIIAATTAANLVNGVATPFTGIVEGDLIDKNDRNEVAVVEKAIANAEDETYTEHLFISVNAYDAMGMMMDGASATLCLAENQFGYVVLQGAADMMVDGMQSAVLSVMDGDIPAYGYVKVMAESRKFTGCGAAAPNTLMRVDTGDNGATPPVSNPSKSMVAAWAIIQDTGMGFFGTEVTTATLSMGKNTRADAMDELACYSLPAAASATQAANTSGDFMMTRCGLIPERHDNSRAAAAAPADMVVMGGPAHNVSATATDRSPESATPRAHAFARYDVGDESMVYVWLAQGMDTDTTKPSERRMLDVVVMCEDGMMMMDETVDGAMTPFQVAAPGMVTMIDPSMGDVGMATMDCEGDRGVLKITMPDKSTAGAVFTHITQMMGHYRMNFPGYGMADPETCFEKGTDAASRKAACD